MSEKGERRSRFERFLLVLTPIREKIVTRIECPSKEELRVLYDSAQACELDKEFVFNLLVGKPTEWHKLLSSMLQLGIDENVFCLMEVSPFATGLILVPDYEANTLSAMGGNLRRFVSKVATKQQTEEKRYLLFLFVLNGDAFQQTEKDRKMAAESFFQLAKATQEIEGINTEGVEMPENMADMFSDSFLRILKGKND